MPPCQAKEEGNGFELSHIYRFVGNFEIQNPLWGDEEEEGTGEEEEMDHYQFRMHFC